MLRLAFIALCAASIAHAADFPSKPVRFVTGANAGSTGDVLGRVLADQLATLWLNACTQLSSAMACWKGCAHRIVRSRHKR